MIFVNFYNNYIHLCNSVEKSPSKVAQEIGVAKATVNRWKNGSLPTDATTQRIAEYFGITVAELFGEEEQKEKPTTQEGDELREDIQNFTAFLQGCSEEETRALFAMSQAFLANLRQAPSAPKEED